MYHLTPGRTTTLKSLEIINTGERAEKRESSYTVMCVHACSVATVMTDSL